jgi:hypothetical protein
MGEGGVNGKVAGALNEGGRCEWGSSRCDRGSGMCECTHEGRHIG